MKDKFNPQRRQFLKVGLIGTGVLVAAAGGIIFTRPVVKCKNCLWLQQGDLDLLQAIVPVVLAGALPDSKEDRAQAINEIITGFDISISYFPSVVRAEIRQLLWLLEFPITRSLFTGVWSAWGTASEAEITDFLESWQFSRFDLFRVGYTALHDLLVGSWYANPRSWSRIHYPGPPALI
jgi:hypothetical protein